jgi:hypothetical protein
VHEVKEKREGKERWDWRRNTRVLVTTKCDWSGQAYFKSPVPGLVAPYATMVYHDKSLEE